VFAGVRAEKRNYRRIRSAITMAAGAFAV